MDNAAKSDLLGRFAAEQSPLIEIGQRLGVEALELVMGLLGPGTVHIPQRQNFWAELERDLRDERMRAEFTGANYEELRVRYGFKTVRGVRKVIHAEKEPKKQTVPARSGKGQRDG